MRREPLPFNVLRSLPRMSWRPLNLYNLWRRSLGPVADEVNFRRSSMTLFQQRWRSKRLVRAYHGDMIPEKKFKRWYLPQRLPDTRIRKTDVGKEEERSYLRLAVGQTKWSNRGKDAQGVLRLREKANAAATKIPLSSLMFIEVERRLDTFIFRCCFAPSVYQARQMTIHGKVRLNGLVQTNPNIRLNPGDMVSVDPRAMTILTRRPTTPSPTPIPDTSDPRKPDVSDTDKNSAASATEPTSSSDSESSESLSPPATPSKPSLDTPMEPVFSFPPYSAPFLFLPAYIEANFTTCSAVYVRHPTARPGYSEIPTPYDADGEVMRFAWEWYSKVRPRAPRKNSVWKSPELARS
ncbi:hypothetical protein BS47DRAFT_1376270 [Hydnum rufescens UP504]|uniref:RNA-binding S4 domain-containing protein n=1 Tax=Hydnum rufescens UP504 TaxID=1448309 RepID=A0A9P6DYW5_9AGAM|nr:hypothetical protein BS47DRAFT_1376270 [Hydnum rufescens UP504]